MDKDSLKQPKVECSLLRVGLILYVDSLMSWMVIKGTRQLTITKTSPCNEDPLTPHFYIGKPGFTGLYIFFLFLLQNIDCGYSLEPPRKNQKIVKIFK